METSFEMVIKIVAGLFIAGIAFLILEVVYDAIARGKARRERIRRLYPIHDEEHHHIAISVHHHGEKCDHDHEEPELKKITRKGKIVLLTNEQYEEMKRVNREKMQAYRAKKKAAKVTRTTKKAKK